MIAKEPQKHSKIFGIICFYSMCMFQMWLAVLTRCTNSLPFEELKVYYLFDRPKPRVVETEFYLAGHWTGD